MKTKKTTKTKSVKIFMVMAIAIGLFSCQKESANLSKNQSNTSNVSADTSGSLADTSRSLAKFEPADGEVILFVGQELEAIGGHEDYSDGYLDHFEKPAGFTMYTTLTRPGAESYGYTMKGLDGLSETVDWGDSDTNISLQIENENFDNMALAIGLSMVNNEQDIANGVLDHLIIDLGEWLISLGNRPVFLRVGYEFDGHSWNHYDREAYLKSFKRIKNIFDSMGVTNVAYVWQAAGGMSTLEQLEDWYPGDDYVDWVGFSFFAQWRSIQMYEFGRLKGKPVFIAEATPIIGDGIETQLGIPRQASNAWKEWFIPFFNAIDENADVIKAVSYINCNWKSHPMWVNNSTFGGLDARLQLSNRISQSWNRITGNSKYLKSSPDLFENLWNN